MNVLVLTSTFPDNAESWRGIFVKEQVDALQLEHNVCVVQCEVDYNLFEPFFKKKVDYDDTFGYPVYRIRVSKSFPVYNQFNYIISVYRSLLKIASKHNPDIIHCHYSYPAGVVAMLLNHKKNIPYVVTEHSRIKATFRSFFHRKLSLMAMKQSCSVCAVSESLRNEILVESKANVEVIPNVVNINRFKVSSGKKNPFVIGFLGSLNTHNKGLDILLNACSKLPFEFNLKIGGGGKHLEFYRKMSGELGIDKHCDFLGNVIYPQTPEFYSNLSVFVLPSHYETFGVVLIEAMASGVPLIATRCGGPNDIISDKVGVLVDVNNINQLKNALISIYSNFEKYVASDIRDEVIARFSYKSFLGKINRCYSKCLAN
jgi:glycosyltransferase involved in cell wall biosynthesis